MILYHQGDKNDLIYVLRLQLSPLEQDSLKHASSPDISPGHKTHILNCIFNSILIVSFMKSNNALRFKMVPMKLFITSLNLLYSGKPSRDPDTQPPPPPPHFKVGESASKYFISATPPPTLPTLSLDHLLEHLPELWHVRDLCHIL